MKCLVLAAGYATRLYPLTKNFPKPLLDVKGKAIIDWVLEDLDSVDSIDEFVIVTNHRFAHIFEEWKKKVNYRAQVTIIDDGTTDNDNRLGAVRDIAYAIKKCKINTDLMVVAGDNLVDFSLRGFVQYFLKKDATCVMRHFEPEIAKLQRTGVIQIDEFDRILEMQEKPQIPKSNWAVPPFYIYKEDDLSRISQAVDECICNVDAPGDFIAWLCSRCEVYAWEMPGNRYDIGNMESYELIKNIYNGVIV